jgi:hypothetical protein
MRITMMKTERIEQPILMVTRLNGRAESNSESFGRWRGEDNTSHFNKHLAGSQRVLQAKADGICLPPRGATSAER